MCTNSHQKHFLLLFFFPQLGPTPTFWTAGSQAIVIGIKNAWARSVTMNLSACCFHLGVTSIICQSCPQIVTEEKKGRWVIMELEDVSSRALMHLGDVPPWSKPMDGRLVWRVRASALHFSVGASVALRATMRAVTWVNEAGGRVNLDYSYLHIQSNARAGKPPVG